MSLTDDRINRNERQRRQICNENLLAQILTSRLGWRTAGRHGERSVWQIYEGGRRREAAGRVAARVIVRRLIYARTAITLLLSRTPTAVPVPLARMQHSLPVAHSRDFMFALVSFSNDNTFVLLS